MPTVSFNHFKSAPAVRPMPNLGCLLDIQTGRYFTGKHGESILNGGMPNFSGVAGLPNMFKTVLSLYICGAVLNHHECAVMQAHDSENTLSLGRIYAAFEQFQNLAGKDLVDLGRLNFSDAMVYMGNEWFEALKDTSKERRGNKDILVTTPFWDEKAKEFVKIPSPMISFLDSLSGLNPEVIVEMFDKDDIGGKGLNMLAMKSSGAKSQMIDQMTNVTAPGGIYSLMTAHVGQEYQLDPYKANIKKLKFLKGDLKLKKVPENFTFLTGNCLYVTGLSPLLDDNKTPEFPRDESDDLKGDTDLILITVVPLRNKFGPSGIPFDIVVSQSEGVKVGLTEYYYLRQAGYYGLSDTNGNQAKGKPNYRLDLYPDVALSRKTIRGKIEESYRLQRAFQITSEMAQIADLWHQLDDEYYVLPKDLYKSLKDKGYDWEILLDTTGFWSFQEHPAAKPFLSTMDLLNMHLGKYHPYWYPKSREELGLKDEPVQAPPTVKADAKSIIGKELA